MLSRYLFAAGCLTLAQWALAPQALAFEVDHVGHEHHHDYAEEHFEARAAQNHFFQTMKEKLQKGEITDINSAASCRYVSYIFKGAPTKLVALTFDDGPSSSSTSVVLSTLRKYGIKGTFFIKGDNGKRNTSMLKQIVNEGHLLANHSWSHPNFHTLGQQAQINQITSTDEHLNLNKTTLRIFRYPYGNSTCFGNNFLRRNGYQGIAGWHVDSCDWAYSNSGYVSDKQAKICGVAPSNKGNFVEHVVSSINKRDGGIVLFHDIHRRTAESMEAIIVRLIRQGYQFVNLDDPRMAPFM